MNKINTIIRLVEFATFIRVITLDLWGFGQSSPVDGKAITMTDYADEVNQVLEQLQINKAIIGGESMGGYIALAFLSKYPEKVTGLILSNTQSIADSEEAKTKREGSAQDVLSNGTYLFVNAFIDKAVSEGTDESVKQELLDVLMDQPAAALASGLRGMALRADTSEILTNTKLPILIITGDQDKVINKQQSINMHELAKNSTLLVLENSGHLSNIEKPEQWNQAVIEQFK
jgi:pimeloyl-ACP methyl ester carboxylesterase